MGRFSRGWALTRQSRDVLKGDASLALFPLLSTIFASLAMVSIWAPKHSAAIIKGRWGEGATGAATIGLVTVGFSFAIALVARGCRPPSSPILPSFRSNFPKNS
jgi:hypothetical protein